MRKYLEAAQERELLEVLMASIKEHGQLLPVVKDRKGNVIDGKQRIAAMKRLGMEPKCITVDRATWKALNVDRRHLSPGQRALIAADLATTERGSNRNAHAAGAVSQGKAAQVCGVSVDTIQRVRKSRALAAELGRDVHAEVDARLARNESPMQVLSRLTVAQEAKTLDKTMRKGTQRSAGDLTAMQKQGARFHVILADPPWDFKSANGTARVAPNHHYPVMSTEQIARLPVKAIAASRSVLWLWVPVSLLEDGLRVMREWGFTYVSQVVWVKPRFVPSPGTVRPQHEVLLFGRRGSLQAAGTVTSVLDARDGSKRHQETHSRKPAEVVQMLERLYPDAARLEMFCRQPRPGWKAWGNQA